MSTLLIISMWWDNDSGEDITLYQRVSVWGQWEQQKLFSALNQLGSPSLIKTQDLQRNAWMLYSVLLHTFLEADSKDASWNTLLCTQKWKLIVFLLVGPSGGSESQMDERWRISAGKAQEIQAIQQAALLLFGDQWCRWIWWRWIQCDHQRKEVICNIICGGRCMLQEAYCSNCHCLFHWWYHTSTCKLQIKCHPSLQIIT